MVWLLVFALVHLLAKMSLKYLPILQRTMAEKTSRKRRLTSQSQSMWITTSLLKKINLKSLMEGAEYNPCKMTWCIRMAMISKCSSSYNCNSSSNRCNSNLNMPIQVLTNMMQSILTITKKILSKESKTNLQNSSNNFKNFKQNNSYTNNNMPTHLLHTNQLL